MSKAAKDKAAAHELALKLVNDNLSKREPVSSCVLAWGWLLKQGEGGLLHADTFKSRWFVLARVPHATVLIYYGRKCMDEDHILGYIDMRRVIAIRDGSKTVTFDGSRSAVNGIVHKLKGFMGFMKAATNAATATVKGNSGSSSSSSSSSSGNDGSSEEVLKPVLELVTSNRVYTLCPCTGESPGIVPMATAAGPSMYGKPLYLFGWPFPVPYLEGAVMSRGEGEDMEDDEEGLAASDAEAMQAANNLLSANDPWSLESFHIWQTRLREVVMQEKASRVFPVVVLVDSTASLQPRIFLRVTPTEIALVSVDDKDVCYGAIPFNDLVKWDVQVEVELHVQAKTRQRLVARSDRTGFQAQRPTKPLSNYVFKSSAAKTIAQCIDHHIKTLAATLGDVPMEDLAGDGEDDDESAAFAASNIDAADEEEENSSKTKAKLTRHQSSRNAAPPSSSNTGKKGVPPRKTGSSGKKNADDDDPIDDSEEEDERSSSKKKLTKGKNKGSDSDDDSEEDTKKSTARKPTSPTVSSSSSSKVVSPKSAPKKADSSDEDEKPTPKKVVAKKADSSDEDEKPVIKKPVKKAASSDEDEKPAPKKATPKKTTSSDEDEKPKKVVPKKADSSEDEKPVKKPTPKKADSSEDEKPAPKKATPKAADSSEDEKPAPKKATPKKADSSDEEVAKPVSAPAPAPAPSKKADSDDEEDKPKEKKEKKEKKSKSEKSEAAPEDDGEGKKSKKEKKEKKAKKSGDE